MVESYGAQDGGRIEVVHGSESQRIQAGHLVDDIRRTLKHVLNIPPEAVVMVNGKIVDAQYVAKPDDMLEFVPAQLGQKRFAWSETELVAKYSWMDEAVVRQRLSEYAATHPQDCCTLGDERHYLDIPDLWLCLRAFGPPHRLPTPNDPMQEPLSEAEQEVYELIRDHGPLSAKEIAQRTGRAESTVSGHLVPALKSKRDIANKRGRGYFVPGHLPAD